MRSAWPNDLTSLQIHAVLNHSDTTWCPGIPGIWESDIFVWTETKSVWLGPGNFETDPTPDSGTVCQGALPRCLDVSP